MRAAVTLGDVVGEAEDRLVVALVPPERDLDADAVLLGVDGDGLGDQRLLGAIDVAHESFEAAFVVQLVRPRFDAAQVRQDDAHARIQEGEFAQAPLQRGVVELDDALEGVGAR